MMTVSMFWCLLFTPGRLLTLTTLALIFEVRRRYLPYLIYALIYALILALIYALLDDVGIQVDV